MPAAGSSCTKPSLLHRDERQERQDERQDERQEKQDERQEKQDQNCWELAVPGEQFWVS